LPSSRQQIIVLAMAAPDLKVNLDGPTSVDTLGDLFNTFVAGFQLSREVADEGKFAGRLLINTGPIGTGDFKNNRTFVAVLQVLAAREVGNVNVKLWGYDSTDIDNTVKPYLKSILDACKASQTPTIRHLIEITHCAFEFNPPAPQSHSRQEPPRERTQRRTRD